MKRTYFQLYYLLFGLIAFGTLAYDTIRNSWQIVNYYSTFTILTISVTSFLFLYIGLVKKDKVLGFNIDAFRGAVVIYLLVIAAVYAFFLAKIPDANMVFWVNLVMHKILPSAGVLGWLIFPPRKNISFAAIIAWLILPIVYFAYILSRGAIVGWYPYYFFDPRKSGYFEVFTFSAKMISLGAVGSFIVIAVGNLLRKN